MFLIRIALVLLCGCISTAYAQNVRTYIPTNAYKYLGLLDDEVQRLFPDGPETAYYGALIEQESCISLTHSRCWSPTSRLKTKREEGAGLVMVTKAYRSDGSIRFDKLSEMANNYKEELKELSWDNVYKRPDLQLRIALLLTKENWKKFYMVKNFDGRLGMSDSAYNGGPRDVQKARTICGLKKGCDPDLWFDHVEKVLPKSTKPIYGTRSAKDINIEHVYNVLKLRYSKYQKHFTTQLKSSGEQ